MKKVITPLLLAVLALQVYGQSAITLTQSNVLIPADTFHLLDVTSQVTSIPAISTNATWDYTGISGATPVSYNYELVSSDANFPTAQFRRTNLVKGLTPLVGFYFDQYYEINASGVQAVGMHVPAQRFGLGPFTGNNTDTIYILDNVITFSSPRDILAFPATAASSWASTVRCVVNMELTVSSASLNHTPLQEAFYFTRTDTVNGWGTLEQPPVSGYMNDLAVLAVKSSEYCVDSFYLNGAPAPPAVTGAFGITQGQVSGPEAYREYLYRDGSFGYQMLFNYTDNTFSALYSTGGAYLNTLLPVTNGISGIDQIQLLSGVYPNPVSGTHFRIHGAGADAAANVSIYDISGRLTQTVSAVSSGSEIDVVLSESLSDGLYIYTVHDKTGKIINRGKLTSKN